ncbi:putative ankyrin repeat protein [Chloropicon roscoffensis]|uniref:Ankyrin repeat protein n=1 Tax=Chloropicon roscoffensis TaxID=1461544 RepID=A0AAX4PBX1_9CHLO
MARGAGEPSTKRAKVDEADEKEEEDPLVRRKEEVVVALKEARSREDARAERVARRELVTLCGKLEAKNGKLLTRLPPELWQKILDENLNPNDLPALTMTCRFFREMQKDLGWKLETDLNTRRFLGLLWWSGKVASHTLGWFQWVCGTFEILPGLQHKTRVKGAVYEGDLVNYAAFRCSVEVLKWLVEEKGWELNEATGWWAGQGGSVEVLEYMSGRGYEFDKECKWAAWGGHLEALKFLRGLDPPCPWDKETCSWAAWGGHLEVLKWARGQDPPCPWDEWTCAKAAKGGHLEVLKWARAQEPPCPWYIDTCVDAAKGGHLDVLKWARSQDPPCTWIRVECISEAMRHGHLHIVTWIDQQEDESYVDYSDFYI